MMTLVAFVCGQGHAEQLNFREGSLTQEQDVISSGTLEIKSDPLNALVSVNGELQGYTPIIIKDIVAGNVVISVSKEGYADTVMNYPVAADRVNNIHFSLKKVKKVCSIPKNLSLIEPTAYCSYHIGLKNRKNDLKGWKIINTENGYLTVSKENLEMKVSLNDIAFIKNGALVGSSQLPVDSSGELTYSQLIDLGYERLSDLYMSISEHEGKFTASYSCRIERALNQLAQFRYLDQLEEADSVGSILFAAELYAEAESGRTYDIYCNQE